MQGTQGQDLADNFPARAVGFEDLIQEPKEGAADRIDAFAAVGAFVGLGQKSGRQQRGEQQIQLQEAVLLELVGVPSEIGEADAPGGKERGVAHDKYIYWSKA